MDMGQGKHHHQQQQNREKQVQLLQVGECQTARILL
jgi:hypothetical protein